MWVRTVVSRYVAVLRVPGDAGAMVAGHASFVRAFATWLAGVRP